MTRPSSPEHRYQLCVDAVAELDMPALAALVCRHRASADDITRAAAQVDRSTAEISAALRTWMTRTRPTLTARHVDRLVTVLTQPSLISLRELS